MRLSVTFSIIMQMGMHLLRCLSFVLTIGQSFQMHNASMRLKEEAYFLHRRTMRL